MMSASTTEASPQRKAAPTPAMRAAFASLLDRVGTSPFRRQDLQELIYPMTKPRNRDRANVLADGLIREAAKAGKVVRHGHLHWVKVQSVRTLRSGREVPEQPEVAELKLSTRVPDKWVAVDLETGEAWVGTTEGWARASRERTAEAVKCLGMTSGAFRD